MTLRPGDPDRHFFLTRSVARVMGLNLSEAIRAGRLAPADYARMVARCRSCLHVGECEEWLSDAPQPSLSAPPECGIAEALHRLRPMH